MKLIEKYKNNVNSINVDKLTIDELFKENTMFIPCYQREYTWGEKNVKVLIEDILYNDYYYIGNIMLDVVAEKLEVIDGQQRLITIYLILLALIKKGILDANYFGNTGEVKIEIGDRASDNNSKVLEYLLRSMEVENVENAPEYKQYKIIEKILSKIETSKLAVLMNNLLHCQIVIICCVNFKTNSDKMFLNLNTKGIQLTNDEKVRSLIFSNLNDKSKFDKLKTSWYDTFSILNLKEREDYLSFYISIFETNKKSKIGKNDIVSEYEKLMNSSDKTNEIYTNLVSNKSSYKAAYFAIVKSNVNEYINLFNQNHVHFTNFFNSFKFIKHLNFVQFNIAFVSMLIFSCNNDKNKIASNLGKMKMFVELVFLYSALKGINNESPSSYANNFIKLAVNLRNKENFDDSIKEILKTFDFKYLSESDLAKWDDCEITHKDTGQKNSKYLNYFKTLIAFLDGSSVCDYNGEHMISESSGTKESTNFANIVPVDYDCFGAGSIVDKIPLYLEKIDEEPHIRIFLQKDYYLDFDKKIANPNWLKDRGKRYKKAFIDKYNELYSRLNGDQNGN